MITTYFNTSNRTYSNQLYNLYSYGFNSMERDDEVKGQGNSYTTEFRQYDPRIARWTSLDPHMAKYPDMSPFVAFNNNPVYYIDPTGEDGVETIDKENKTVTVELNFYYDKTNPEFKGKAITEDYVRGDGTVFKSDVTKLGESGWESKNGSKVTVDGEEWSINYKINFIGLENAEAVAEKLKEDPTANALDYKDWERASGGMGPKYKSIKFRRSKKTRW